MGAIPAHLASKNRADLDLMAALVRTGAGGIPVYHCLGNHDLNLPRHEVWSRGQEV
jgi:DNA repair exonuclease SbcCD nuclease subunit